MVELAKDKYIDLHDTLCKTKELKHLLDFINSLPEPQLPSDVEMETVDLEIADWCGKYRPDIRDDMESTARHFYYYGAKKGIAYEKSKPYYSLPSDVEEAAKEYAYQGIPEEMKSELKPIGDEVIKNFKAGAEWQAERFLKGSPMPEDTVIFQKGIEEGKRLMTEDAVEGTVCKGDGDVWIELSPNAMPHFKDMQPVKVIVIKED